MKEAETRSPVTLRESRQDYVLGSVHHELTTVVGKENVSADPQKLAEQAIDYSWMARYRELREMPLPSADLAVWPTNKAEVAEVVRIASDYGLPIIPRGAGSGSQGGTFAPYGGIALDLTRMNRIIDVDTQSLTVTTEAGVDAPMLEKALSPEGLTLAHDPGGYYWGATVGGWIAARGSGVTSTKYGKAEDMLLQVEAVVPPGQEVSTLPVPSHAAGPGLLQLLAGSEGTLGVIATASMRLDPVPRDRRFLSFRFASVFEGLEAGRAIMTSRWRPAVIRLYDEAGSQGVNRMLDLDTDGVLMIVVCDGDPRLTEVESKAIRELCVEHEGVDLGPSPAEKWWEGRYEPHTVSNAPAPPTIFGTTDACCTFDKIADLYKAKKAAIEEGFSDWGARYTAHFSHWYPWGTMIYDRFYVDEPPDDPEEALELHDRLWDAAVRTSLRCGAVLNDHHGVGVKLGRFMREQYGETFSLLRAVKDAWDPDGIMNPGKLGFGPPRRGS